MGTVADTQRNPIPWADLSPSEKRHREKILSAGVERLGHPRAKNAEMSIKLDDIGGKPYADEFSKALLGGAKSAEALEKIRTSPNKNMAYYNQLDELLLACAKLLDRCVNDRELYDRLSTDKFKAFCDVAKGLMEVETDDWVNSGPQFWEISAKAESDAFQLLNENYIVDKGVKWNKNDSTNSILPDNTNSVFPWAEHHIGSLDDSYAKALEKLGLNWTHANFWDICEKWYNFRRNKKYNENKMKAEENRKCHLQVENYANKAKAAIKKYEVYAKLNEYSVDGGALDYENRMKSVIGRVQRDFDEAILKIEALKVGIEIFLGIIVPLDFDASNLLDECVRWIRTVSNEMGATVARESKFWHRISLMEKGLSPNDLLSGRQFRIGFQEIPETSRLQGISAILVGGQTEEFMSIDLTLPDQRLKYPLHQPTVRLGRVQHNMGAMPPDICGLPLIKNLSPVGEWTIKSARPVERAQDLCIDLLLADSPEGRHRHD